MIDIIDTLELQIEFPQVARIHELILNLNSIILNNSQTYIFSRERGAVDIKNVPEVSVFYYIAIILFFRAEFDRCC